MNVFLIGRGQLGKYLAERFQVPPEFHFKGDLEEVEIGVLKDLKPRAVINTAGKTSLEWCEENPLETFRCNVKAPLGLFRKVKEAFGSVVPFIHLSSGCVWDGPYKKDGTPFFPEDPPTPACYYAWTKSACDAMIRAEASQGTSFVLRPRQVFSGMWTARNTLDKLRRYPALIDTPNSMTSVATIARTVRRIVDLSVFDRCFTIMNVYDKGISSPFSVGEMMAEAGLRTVPLRQRKDELDKVLVPRRVDAVIRDHDFEELVNPPMLKDSLADCIEQYKSNMKTRGDKRRSIA